MSDSKESIDTTEEDSGPINSSKRVRYVVKRQMEVEAECEIYLMNRKTRKAFIFNQNTFEPQLELNDRPGTEKDVARLTEILPLFRFTVEVFEDLTKIDLLKTIKDISSGNYDDCDCLAFFVLSHGREHSIAAKDDFYYSDELWNSFSCTGCPTMAGKPKLFFINACRGEKMDQDSTEFYRDLTIDGFNEDKTVETAYHLVYNIPNMADIFIAYSTFDGHVSHRMPSKGSWFIQALCDVLEDGKFKNMEIKQILTRVTNKVALMISTKERTKQVPVLVSTLIRDLYL